MDLCLCVNICYIRNDVMLPQRRGCRRDIDALLLHYSLPIPSKTFAFAIELHRHRSQTTIQLLVHLEHCHHHWIDVQNDFRNRKINPYTIYHWSREDAATCSTHHNLVALMDNHEEISNENETDHRHMVNQQDHECLHAIQKCRYQVELQHIKQLVIFEVFSFRKVMYVSHCLVSLYEVPNEVIVICFYHCLIVRLRFQCVNSVSSCAIL
mmetsp:Transcript_12332/g.20734  ORF Transcript_12332/g.20734 Transcript_12332/m.20734 type:complete len:210 (-) Transcript_12332:159-788(-)